MNASLEDEAPKLVSIKVPLEDGGEICVSHPRFAVDAMSRENRNLFLDSLGRMVGNLILGDLPDEEDVTRVMSVEGASIMLPVDHGSIEMQTLFGQQLTIIPETDAHKYADPPE